MSRNGKLNDDAIYQLVKAWELYAEFNAARGDTELWDRALDALNDLLEDTARSHGLSWLEAVEVVQEHRATYDREAA